MVKTATSQNGDKPKRRQVHRDITKTATNRKVDIVTQYERVKEYKRGQLITFEVYSLQACMKANNGTVHGCLGLRVMPCL